MRTVILVDDEYYSLLDMNQSLDWQRFGFQVVAQFTDPEKALQVIIRVKPDVVFTDIRMPKMSGLELIRSVQEQGVCCQFVITSGYADFEYARESIRLGIVEYCLKPLDEELGNTLLQNLSRKLSATDQPEDTGSPDSIKRQLEDFIMINLHRQITLADLCKELNSSVSQCCQLFRTYFHTTFLSYLIEKRMSYARELVKTTTLPIKDISVRSGYTDYFYFCKVYTKQYGISPSKDRKQIEDSHETL